MDVRSPADEIRHRLADIAGPDPGPAERALLARLIRSFAGKTPGGVEVLGELLRGGNRPALRDQAHGLKGSAANIGADTLAGIFAEVEHAARDGGPLDPGAVLDRIAAEQALVLGALDEVAAELDQ
jgi:histidine phosphotransfer protein HptB